MQLLLVRHGATAWNAAGRLQGQSDVPLSPPGQAQAQALARAIATESVQAVYSSDLQRARQTAHCIATALDLPVQYDARWREMSFGLWESLNWEEIQQRDAATWAAWQADPLHVAPPQGETLTQVHDRVKAALTCLVAAQQTHSVVVVSHGGPLRLLLCLALGLPPQAHWRFQVDPGSLSELLLYGQEATLSRLNYLPHPAGENDDG